MEVIALHHLEKTKSWPYWPYKAKRDYTDEVYSPIFLPFIVLIKRLKVSIGTFLNAKVILYLDLRKQFSNVFDPRCFSDDVLYLIVFLVLIERLHQFFLQVSLTIL